MAENTAISWARHTFNPWMGCTKVSPACDGCYAEALMDKRYGKVKWGPHGDRVRTVPTNWNKVRKWHRDAANAGEKWFIFCASLADIFDNQVPPAWRKDLLDLCRECPNLIFLFLSKRPQNMVRMSEEAGGLPPNCALGATCEDQKRADINLPHLLIAASRLRAAFAFGSFEPLLGPVDAGWAMSNNPLDVAAGILEHGHFSPGLETLRRIEWVITGGETDQGDHKARPSDPAWFRRLRDQCAAAGVAYHHKQNGEWISHEQMGGGWEYTRTKDGVRYGVLSEGGFGRTNRLFGGRDFPTEYPWNTAGPGGWGPGPCMVKVGKHNSGRLLDAREHNAFPEVA
ncbi:DUF5131 family protein [Mesorhizobium sp. M1B.F.Ca.ET.045.04.1.1]|nr:DUF5131 family protein [Mesorhizobium sp. M1B.F.Ca.ET.045.04.1.1]AZO29297.1 DUF5131 family protein [Mesorhizobium sp. M1B.F.Ca.ET.045.04.1.1]